MRRDLHVHGHDDDSCNAKYFIFRVKSYRDRNVCQKRNEKTKTCQKTLIRRTS